MSHSLFKNLTKFNVNYLLIQKNRILENNLREKDKLFNFFLNVLLIEILELTIHLTEFIPISKMFKSNIYYIHKLKVLDKLINSFSNLT